MNHHDCDDLYCSHQDAATVPLHTPENYASMRKAGQFAAGLLDYITDFVVPGVTTEELDRLCEAYTASRGSRSAPLGYKGFPKSICTSINHVVCHGIPGPRKLEDGDIVNIDVTPITDGWHGDTSRMFYVGKPSIKAQRLVEATYMAMMQGIEAVKPGATLGDIGYAIQSYAESKGYSVVRDFCGHGVGRVIHGPPSVMHFGKPGKGLVLQEGMFFTIEPMINIGGWQTKILQDGWTAVTRDRSLSAQFEHTLAVTATGYEIFTLSPKGYTCPPFIRGV